MTGPTRETTPLTLDEERAAHDLLDSIDPPACEYSDATLSIGMGTEPCREAASWILKMSCRHDMYLCAEHRAIVADWLDEPGLNICRKRPHPRPTQFDYVWGEVR